jgi:hypothetical protein
MQKKERKMDASWSMKNKRRKKNIRKKEIAHIPRREIVMHISIWSPQ